MTNEENILNDNLLEKFHYDKDKLLKAIFKNCNVVFDNINDDGERNIYLISDVDIDDKYILSFLLTKDDIPVSSHIFSIEDIYDFEDLNKKIIKEINS